MPTKLIALLMLATGLSAQAAEDRKLTNAVLIGDAIYQNSIRRQEQRFVDNAREAAPGYIAQARSKRTVDEIADMAARDFDAAHWRNITWFPFFQGMTLTQQEDVIRFLKTPAGKAFLAALEKSNDSALQKSGSAMTGFFHFLFREEFDPQFRARSTSTPEQLEKNLEEMFAEPRP